MDYREIKELRINMGLSQENFAHRLGVTLGSVNRWETNNSRPGLQSMAKIRRLKTEFQHQVDLFTK